MYSGKENEDICNMIILKGKTLLRLELMRARMGPGKEDPLSAPDKIYYDKKYKFCLEELNDLVKDLVVKNS